YGVGAQLDLAGDGHVVVLHLGAAVVEGVESAAAGELRDIQLAPLPGLLRGGLVDAVAVDRVELEGEAVAGEAPARDAEPAGGAVEDDLGIQVRAALNLNRVLVGEALDVLLAGDVADVGQ